MTNLKVWKFQYPYPINDWKDEKSYPIKRTPKEWAWEFLRRNKDYQYDYDRCFYNQGFPEYEIIVEDELSLEWQKKRIDELRFLNLDSDENINNFIISSHERALSTRIVKSNGYECPLKNVILEKYKLFPHRLIHPRESLPINNFFDADRDGIQTLYYNPKPKGDRFSIAPIKPEHLVVRLNANVSLPKQLEHITKCLKNISENLDLLKIPSKPSDSALLNYIRALDAKAAKAEESHSIREIVNRISDKGHSSNSPNKEYSTWMACGLKLSNNDYFHLFDK